MKEKISKLINLFSVITVTIFIFSSIYISIFWGAGTEIPLSYVFGVLLIGAVCTLAYIPLLNDEYSKVTMIILNTVHFLICNTSVILTGYYLKWFSAKTLPALELTVILVYTAVTVICYAVNDREAKKLTELLHKRQR
ncbi:MAG: DUF3021 family protein [Treponema sp.]|uniref:DUF3021 family protein n=1 Tax=Treponema sp. TaxID=166 RepID=UPI00298E6E35|nr:DUF3021 family protein [Treponema sp.]MBR5933024.1 DUF3021 family protein [Treponema sp.]